MKIGIIGAENSHTAAIAKIINIDGLIKGFSVDYVWGETKQFAQAAAKAGQIPNIVEKPREMLGKIDALIVDHRHPKYHLKPALPFIKQGIPTFIDKPFCYRTAEGREFLQIARKNNVPVTSFSVVPEQASFRRFVSKLPDLGNIIAGTTYGACDLKSEHGGVFFYGIHQVDMALNAFGYDVTKVSVTRNGNGNVATGQLFYPDGKVVTMNLIKSGSPGFAIGAVGTEGHLFQPITYDKNTYLSGIKTFTRLFRTGEEPIEHKNILKPVQVLEAMQRSVKSAKPEKVLR